MRCDRKVSALNPEMNRAAIQLSEDELASLQKTLLEIYIDIMESCRRHGITPFLCGGSALGAVRHNGFIPWDDDLDIAMTRRDYDVFRGFFREELGDKYILNAPNYSRHVKARFPKVIKRGTIFQEIGTVLSEGLDGVFVDIFLIDNVPDNKILRNFKGLLCNALEFLSGCVYDFENLDDVAKIFHKQSGLNRYRTRMLIGRIGSIVPSSRWFHVIDKVARWEKEDSAYWGLVTGRKHYFGEIFPKSALYPVRNLPFESIQAPVFHDVELYLTNLYGDYMRIPPEEERERHWLKKFKL